jgi:carbon-monoxide dehydrogenase large subunit
MSTVRTPSPWVGRSIARKEDLRLLKGRGQYIADILLPGMLHLVFARSTQAHARIRRLDVTRARGMRGVLAVVTGEDVRTEIQPLPVKVVQPNLTAKYPTFWPLAVGKVCFHGEPIAAVVATDKYLAEDAALAITAEYDPLPVVTDPEAALRPDAPRLNEDWDDNVMFSIDFGEDVSALIAEADVVVRERFRVHRVGVTPLEPRGVLARWEEPEGMTVWITNQRPHVERLALADVLEIPAQQMRVIAPRDQGGAFGTKAPFYREEILVCHLARQLGRPIRWIETREEHLMAVSQERDQIHDLEVAARRDGRILAIRDRALGDVGDAKEGVYWGYLMPFIGAALMPNGYDIPKLDIKLRCVVTNKSALSPARAFGSFPTRFAMDRALDMLARRLGLETAAVMRVNLIKELPHTTATGVYYDSGDYRNVFDTLLAKVDLLRFRKEQAAAESEGRRIGIGFATGTAFSGVSSEVLVPVENQPGYGAAAVRIDPRGKVFLAEGDAPHGQGHETVFAQAAADEFGIHPDDVVLSYGDTTSTPFGSGTIGARGASYTVSAVVEACRHLKAKMARILAHDLKLPDAGPEDFDFVDGEIVYRRDSTKRRAFAAHADRIVMGPLDLPAGESGGLEHTAFFEAAKPMYGFSAHAAVVEVDPESGQFKILRYLTVEDVGRPINPRMVESQVQGGVVQGLSNTMYEQFVYDSNGQQLSTSFATYRMASAADVPNVEVYHADTPCPLTPLGTRGLGEGVPGPVPATLANAVVDALAPLGVEITSLPLRPDRLWAAIQARRRHIQ